MRSIEIFLANQMYLDLSLVERKVSEFYHNMHKMHKMLKILLNDCFASRVSLLASHSCIVRSNYFVRRIPRLTSESGSWEPDYYFV